MIIRIKVNEGDNSLTSIGCEAGSWVALELITMLPNNWTWVLIHEINRFAVLHVDHVHRIVSPIGPVDI